MMGAAVYILWLLLIGAASFAAWFFLNSRQWLLAWLWLPVLLAAGAAGADGWVFAVIVYFLTLCAMMAPTSGLFSLLADTAALNRSDLDNFESWRHWNVKDMWQNPKPMRQKPPSV